MKNAVTAWAEKNGYNYKFFGNDGKPAGILIYTDYFGAYPPAGVYAEHEKIRRYCIRTGRKYSCGAMHTGARVYF